MRKSVWINFGEFYVKLKITNRILSAWSLTFHPTGSEAHIKNEEKHGDSYTLKSRRI